MQVLLSVPGGVLKAGWHGSIVPGEAADEVITESTIAETVGALRFHLSTLGLLTKIVVRPEIFTSPKAHSYVTEKVPDLSCHIFVGPPHRLKYLKGIRNLACFSPIGSTEEAKQIVTEFTFNPRRLQQVQANLNGFSIASLLRMEDTIRGPIILPSPAAVSPAPTGSPKFVEPLVTPLFLNNHDAKNSAEIMISRLRPLTEHLASRPGILGQSPVFLAPIAAHHDFATGLGPALRDFAYLAIAGVTFTVIVLVEDAATLTIEILEKLAARLNEGLRLAGLHPGLVESDAIIVTPLPRQVDGLLRLSNYLLLLDFNWLDSKINQRAIVTGVKPVLLGSSSQSILKMFSGIAFVVPQETRHLRQTAADLAIPFHYPATGSLQKIMAGNLVDHLSPQARTINSKHVLNVLRDASELLRVAVHPSANEPYEIRFG